MDKGEKESLENRLKYLKLQLKDEKFNLKFIRNLTKNIESIETRFTGFKFTISEFHHTQGQRFDVSLNDTLIIQRLQDGASIDVSLLHLVGNHAFWEEQKFQRGIAAIHQLINEILKKIGQND